MRRLLVSLGTTSVANVAVTGSAFLLHLVLTRVLREQAYGLVSYVITWATLLALVAKLGLDTSIVRFFATYRVREQWSLLRGFQRSSRLVCLSLGLTIGVAWAALSALGIDLPPALRTGFLLGACNLPLFALLGLEEQALRGLGRVALSTVPLGILQPLLLAAAISALAWVGRPVDATTALILHFATLTVGLVMAMDRVRATLPAAARSVARRYQLRHWLTVSLPLMLVSGTRRILNQVDVILIGILIGTTEAGFYGIAARISRLINFGFKVGNLTTGPLIAELHSQGRKRELQRVVTTATWAATLASLAIALGLILTRGTLLRLFGPAFTAASNVLLILACGQLVNAWTGPVEQLLALTGHERINARISVTATAVNVALNIPAIVWMGMEGAALVTSIVIAAKNVWFWYAVRRQLGVDSSIFGRLS